MSDGTRSSQEGHIFHKRSGSSIEKQLLAERLIDWFLANGGWLSPDVEVAYDESRGFHLRALRSLASPVVVKCPLRLTLSFLNLDHRQSTVHHIDSALRKLFENEELPNHVLTYLLLIEQRYRTRTERSEWHHYVSCLPGPELMTNSLFFDKEDLECLVGTNLAGATRDKLNELTKEWQHAVKVMNQASISIPDLYELKLFLWASTIMSSRSFISSGILPDKETFPILFPVVDILNHSVDAKVEWDFTPLQDFTLKLVDYEAIRPGDEVFNNYAPKQNDELLLGYGFCIQDNPVEQFTIKIALPPPVEERASNMGLYDKQNVAFGMSADFLNGDPKNEQHFLRPKGYRFGRYDNNVPCLREIPPWIVHIFFFMALMNLSIDIDGLENKERPPANIALEVLILLYEAIDQKCQRLPLEPQSRTDFPNEKQRYAAIYREGQAKIVHGIRDEIEAVIDIAYEDQERVYDDVGSQD